MVSTMSLEKARLYEQYRLPYPHEIVDDLFEHVGSAAVIADIGAGTGQLARLFAPRCQQLYAIEPDSAMQQVATEALSAYPNVHVLSAVAEQTTLPDESIDLITIGNAFHWFRVEAIAEIHRILKPAGWAAVISYTFTDRSFSDMLFPKLSALEGMASRLAKTWHRVPVANLFGDHPTHTLRYAQSITENWEAFWGVARSGIEAPEPEDAEFAQFEAINREVFDAFSVDGQIRIEYETCVSFGQPKP